MKILYIKHFGEEKPIALVYSNLDGTFRVESEDNDAKVYFQDLIQKIASENPTLPLRSGEVEKIGDKVIHKTIQKQIDAKDEKYLDALWDYFNHQKLEYNGVRFRAYTNEGKPQLTTDKIIQTTLFNLSLNIPNFPKLTTDEYKNLNIVGYYYLTGPEVTGGKIPIPEFIQMRMKDEGKTFNSRVHVLINIPQEKESIGAPSIAVIELPRPIAQNNE